MTPLTDREAEVAHLRGLSRGASRPTVAHFWSPSMPLSLEGLPHALDAARSLGGPFAAVEARAFGAPTNDDEERARSRLVREDVR